MPTPATPPSDPSPRPPVASGSNFAALYRNTVAPLRRYLTRFLGNPADAQDVAQDAYLRVLPHLEAHTAEKPEALLYTTARRLALNKIKRRKISPFDPSPLAAERTSSAQPGVVQTVIARQELALLEQAIAALPPGCRSVLVLRKVELCTHEEIASRLGIAISTVEKQHARALRLLRAALAPTVNVTSAPPPAASGQEANP